MAHDLFGARYIGRKPAWHKLGKTFEAGSQPTLVEAYRLGRLDYEFLVETTYAIAEGNYIEFPERKMIIRKPTDDDPVYRPIEVVSADYELIQNMELAQMFNYLSTLWPVETVGALGKGERTFATLNCGTVDIAGEPVEQYWILNDNKVGTGLTNAFFCNHEVVCRNTLESGLAQSNTTIGVKHVKGNKDQLGAIAAKAEEMIQKAQATTELFRGMAKVRFSVDEFQTAIKEILYPAPVMPEDTTDVKKMQKWDSENSKVTETHQDLYDLFCEYADTRTGRANNLLGLVSVVADYEQFGRKGRGNSQYEDAMFGKRANSVKNAVAFAASRMK